MSFDRSVDVLCDGCGKKGQCDSRTAREAERQARLAGWRRVRSDGTGHARHYCLRCQIDSVGWSLR